MKPKTKKNLNRRARKILSRVRKLGLKDTLLDLTPLDEQEAKTFLESEEDRISKLAVGAWTDLANSFAGIDRGIAANWGITMHKMRYSLKDMAATMQHLHNGSKVKEGQIIGLRGDLIMLDDPRKNPLTLGEKIHSLLEKEIESK